MNDLAMAGPGLGAVHPAIDHALAAFDAPSACCASRAIADALAERLACDDPWTGSRLTGDGYPCEIAFATSDARVRFTVEPGAPSLAAGARLDVAARVLERLGDPAIPQAMVAGLREMQAAGPLSYGAWIGGRVGAHGFAGKLYVEVPPGAALRARSLQLPGREVTPRMVAYVPATGTFEAYFRARALEPGELAAVLVAIGAEQRAQQVHDFIEEAHGHRIRDRYPGPVGVSYGWPNPDRLTLYFYARSMWGPDAAIRRGFSHVARGLGADDGAYLRATEPMAERNDWKTWHGLFGLTLDTAGALSAAIGIRPVAP
jgi:hypothetical protein